MCWCVCHCLYSDGLSELSEIAAGIADLSFFLMISSCGPMKPSVATHLLEVRLVSSKFLWTSYALLHLAYRDPLPMFKCRDKNSSNSCH